LEYLDASSARRNQIRERMEKHGLHGYEAADIAAHASRSEKLMQTPAEVLAAHRQLAAEYCILREGDNRYCLQRLEPYEKPVSQVFSKFARAW
jgi:hypothetical protein